MDIKLSERVQRIKPSPTLAVTALANQLKAEGRDVIGLGAGEPDFDTPEHIKEAATAAMRAGKTKYTPVGGTASLKQAIIGKFEKDNHLTYTPKQILVSSGGKQSFYNLCQAYINDGDEVIIPAPYWVSYPDMVLLAGGVPVIVSADQSQGFKISPEQLEAAITPKSRLLVINSPSNPTGAAYTKAELIALSEVLLKHPDILIATDDMYEHIMFAGETFYTLPEVCPDLYDRTIVLNGVSKAYSMTGWRIGYAGGPEPLIKAMDNIQSQSTSNPCSISQAAAEAALTGDQSCVTMMSEAFEKRCRYVVDTLNGIAGINCIMPAGTFYCFPNVDGMIESLDGVANDLELSAYLLEKVGVALVPGSAFGLEGHIRISFATSQENLENALQRIASITN